MFPDETPAEEQHEVRTIEEETLFRVAYPEVVEKYLQEKSMAEEKKTRSKTVSQILVFFISMCIYYISFSVFSVGLTL